MKFAMIADDLTGANANCSLLKKLGIRTASLHDFDPKGMDNMEAVAVTTGSRAVDSVEAYHKVFKLAQNMERAKPLFLSKRIDSTLRGNLGAELSACMDALPGKIPLIVPVYPASGRVVIHGTMFVNGKLLHHTEAGRDSKTPVLTSSVREEFMRQYPGEMLTVPIEEVDLGAGRIAELIRNNRKSLPMIFDGMTRAHLEAIAQGAMESKCAFFTVDPGPFTLELARLVLEEKKILGKIMLLVGSVTELTVRQVKELLYEVPCEILEINAKKLTEKNRDEEIEEKIKLGKENLEKSDVILVTTTPFTSGEKRLDLSELSKESGKSIDELSLEISEGLTRVGSALLEWKEAWAGVFTTGGDITLALVETLGAAGLEVKEEIMPLVAYGRLIGGRKDGLRIISKGGLVGDEKTMIHCLERLQLQEEKNE